MANQKPEKLVEKEVVFWCRVNGWSVDIVESKAHYSVKRGHYRSTIVSGFPDIVGCTEVGHSAYIELKAKGLLKTIKPHQREFLQTKIRCGAFAVCVDSSYLLQEYYHSWFSLLAESRKAATAFLLDLLA